MNGIPIHTGPIDNNVSLLAMKNQERMMKDRRKMKKGEMLCSSLGSFI